MEGRYGILKCSSKLETALMSPEPSIITILKTIGLQNLVMQRCGERMALETVKTDGYIALDIWVVGIKYKINQFRTAKSKHSDL